MCGHGIWHASAIIVTGQELMQASDKPPSSAPAAQRSFITSTIISSAILPVRRAGHCSRGSLVVAVVVAVVAFLLAVLSMYVPVASSVDLVLSQSDRNSGPLPEPPSRLSTSKLVLPLFSNNSKPTLNML